MFGVNFGYLIIIIGSIIWSNWFIMNGLEVAFYVVEILEIGSKEII